MPTVGAGKILKRCVATESASSSADCPHGGRANPGTIQDKFLVGYQGWFTCGNDGPPIGEGHHGWLHWLNQPLAAKGRPNTDLWPDTSAYEPSELYTVDGLTHRDGSPAKVFSSRDPRTVRRHFHWMAEYGVDGAFLQRFVGQVDPEEAGNRDARFGGTRRLRDDVGRRVREAAEAEGRVWAIMYDASGVPAADIVRIMTQDFAHLVHEERIFDSPAYLRERTRPVVAVWGFGLSDSPVPPHTARAVFDALRAIAPDVYIFAGTPSHWRSPGQGDAHADPAWAQLWLGKEGAVDAVSPWSVGRYSTAAEVERWAAERWEGDAELIGRHNEGVELGGGGGRRVDYVPVVLPGGSGFNLSERKWAFNGIKRNGGKFLWSQIFHAKRLKGVRTMYGAMWDEYDEGTAFLPVVEKKRLLPESETWPFLSLDEDGYDLPSDWLCYRYMRVAGFAAEGLRSERRIHDSFPSKELQDYWSSRPKYEEEGASSSSSSTSASTTSSTSSYPAHSTYTTAAAFDIWAEEQRLKEAETEDMPPPAYSLEAEEPVPIPVQAQPVQQPQQQSVAQPQHQNVVAPQLVSSPPPQQQRFQQQQQQPQQQNVASSPPPQQQHFGADAAASVTALAGDFARQRIAAEVPPLHPSHPGRMGSGSSTSSYSSPSQGPRPTSYPGQAPAAGYAPPSGPSPPAGYAPPPGPSPPAGYAPPPGPSPPAGYAPPAGPSPPASYGPPAGPSPPAGYAPPSGPPSTSSYGAPSAALGRASSYQPSTSYAAPPGAGLGYSSSLSARPDSAHRPTTPGYASYPPAAAAAGSYPSSPPPHGGPPHASLAPRPESVRPTTPGYAGQSGPPRPPPGPMGPPQHSSYSNQYPSHNSNGPPPTSYPGSSYNPPPAKLPSPEIPGPTFPPGPMASQYAAYNSPPHPPPHQSPAPFPGQSFPAPHQGGGFPTGPPPPGSPPYPPAGPSFPQGGSDNNGYFYQQPQPPFPGAGYSPQPDMYHNNYAHQPQGPWAQGGRPPQMPHRESFGFFYFRLFSACVYVFLFRAGKSATARVWLAVWSARVPYAAAAGTTGLRNELDGQDRGAEDEGAARGHCRQPRTV
ncbi:hypothetical protein C8R46DRAFT_906556 [Mycena filopes]|nr:hypothetical protein C8R46DRAFT_906556 [Mycena filopes]